MQDNQLKKNNKGVTLVEVIAVVAVLSVVMAAVAGFMITGARMSAQVSGTAKANNREFMVVDSINRSLWNASEAVYTSDPKEVEIAGKTLLLSDRIGIGSDFFISTLTDETGSRVVMNGTPVLDGEIYFSYDKETNTVTYYLNGTKHVVHLRTEPTTD